MPLIPPESAWPLWAFIVAGAALSIWLEQTYKWAAKMSGPVLALLLGMALSNSRLLPFESPTYSVVSDYLVRAAIPLLLFRANIVRIWRQTGTTLIAFHIAALGTVSGAFLAAFLFRGTFARVPEVTGIMTASYVGGGVNFVAVKESYNVSSELTNPLLVADNFIMAGMFAVLLVIAVSKFFRRHYPHPHSLAGDQEDVRALAARHWRRKEVALLDIAQALAIAFAIAAVSVLATDFLKARVEDRIIRSIFANPFVFITILTVALTTLGQRWTEKIQGAEDLGMFLLYLFFVVLGLEADFLTVMRNVPVLFPFCFVIAAVNLVFTLGVGKLFRLNLEDLLLGVNATLGGPPSAAAMAISRGWSNLVLPGLLAGIWGYVIGTFVGIAVTEAVKKVIP